MARRIYFRILSYLLVSLVLNLILPANNIYGQRTVSVGTQQQFESDLTYWMDTDELDDTHFICAFKSATSSVSGTASDLFAVVGVVDKENKTVSYGSVTTIETDLNSRTFVIGISATQAVVGYELDAASDIGKVRVLTISGTSITNVGSAVQFCAGDYTTPEAAHIGSGKIVITYDDLEAGSYGTAVIGNVSGNSVTFGIPQVFISSHVDRPSVCVLASDKLLFGFEDDDTEFDPGKAIIATVSGTTMSFGNAATFYSSTANAARYTSVAPLSSGYFVVAYIQDDQDDAGAAIIGSYSGTTISFPGASVQFETSFASADIDVRQLNEDEFVIAWNGSSTSNPSKIIIGERNGNGIDFGTAQTVCSAQGDEISLGVLDADAFVVGYTDDNGDPADQGDAVVCTLTPAVAPVELISFNASMNNNSVTLNWETATEVDNYGFEIERSSDNMNTWNNIGFVAGHGNSNSPKSYSFSDNISSGGTQFYYRLKQFDLDGAFDYSDAIEVNFDKPVTAELEQNYPNPFNPSTSIRFSVPAPGAGNISSANVRLVIYDMLGREIAVLTDKEMNPGNHIAYWHGTDKLGRQVSAGTYLYSLIINGKPVNSRKMLLLK